MEIVAYAKENNRDTPPHFSLIWGVSLLLHYYYSLAPFTAALLYWMNPTSGYAAERMTGTAGRMGVGAGSITVAGGGLHHRLYDDTGRKEEIWIMKLRPVYSKRS